MKAVDLKLYSEYERVQKEYNKLRKKLIRKTKRYSEDNTSGRLPSMVIPERKRKIPLRTAMRMSRREMWRRINALRKVVNEGESGFYRKFKRSYFELYRMAIGEEPEAFNGYRYSEQQIAEMSAIDSDLASLMDSYNALFQMPAEIFFLLLRRGDIPSFKRIYEEAVGGVSYYESVLGRLSNIAHGWKRMIKRGEISDSEIRSMEKETKESAKRVKSTFTRAEKGKKTLAGKRSNESSE